MRKIEITEAEKRGGILHVIAEVNEYAEDAPEGAEPTRQLARTPFTFGHKPDDAVRRRELGEHAYDSYSDEAVRATVADVMAPYVDVEAGRRATQQPHLLGEIKVE